MGLGNVEDVNTPSHPLMKQYKKKAFDKYAAKDERWGVFYTAGILFAEPLVEGIKRAGRDLTRERLVKELEGLKDFKGIGGRISYAPFNPTKGYETRQGTKETMLVECLDNGVAKLLTDWFQPGTSLSYASLCRISALSQRVTQSITSVAGRFSSHPWMGQGDGPWLFSK